MAGQEFALPIEAVQEILQAPPQVAAVAHAEAVVLGIMSVRDQLLPLLSLRSLLGFCNAPQMNSPEAYIQFKPGLVDDQGEVTVESTREFLRKYMAEFHGFISRVLTVLPRTGDPAGN